MLVHLVLFNFKEGLSEVQKKRVLDEARNVLPGIPGVMNLMAGRRIRETDEYEYAISMYFLDKEELETYRAHPDHVKFRDADFFPFVSNKLGIDYED